jgi:hypothetical protein
MRIEVIKTNSVPMIKVKEDTRTGRDWLHLYEVGITEPGLYDLPQAVRVEPSYPIICFPNLNIHQCGKCGDRWISDKHRHNNASMCRKCHCKHYGYVNHLEAIKKAGMERWEEEIEDPFRGI